MALVCKKMMTQKPGLNLIRKEKLQCDLMQQKPWARLLHRNMFEEIGTARR
jgi:hypothetical protein